jgi:non-ribosomal peptide synthetase component E (peptide arylation enzyme)
MITTVTTVTTATTRQSSRATVIAGFKAPRYVEFLQALPLKAAGKVMKDQVE